MNLVWFAFLTGLTTGGISCLAVQGGLLATAITEEGGPPKGLRQSLPLVALFLVFKLLGYALVGFVLGLVGSTLVLAPRIMGFVQIAVGLFMITTALRLIDAHPIFRYFVITPPRWTFRLLKNTSRSGSWFAPALLGLFTIFMPCGITQATMAIAIATGSPWQGAGIMAAFVLGTSPVFLALGATIIELLQKKIFSYVAATIVAIFAVISINGGVGLTGSPYTLQNFYRAAITPIGSVLQGEAAPIENGVQRVTIKVTNRGYSSTVTSIKAGVPVELTLETRDVLGCARAFTIPDLGISKVLPGTGDEKIDFTPTKTGTLVYSCSMGMYTGSFEVL